MKSVLKVLVVASALTMGWVCLKAQGQEYHSFYYSPRGGWSYGYHYQPHTYYRGYYAPRYYSYPYGHGYHGYHGYHGHNRGHHRCR